MPKLRFIVFYYGHIKHVMPFLYFATYRNDSNIYAKFGHCKDKDRLKAYRTTNPCLDYAVLKYNFAISDYKLLDNYIYDRVIHKNNVCAIVNFERKSDWFYTQRETTRMLLSYIRQLESLDDVTELRSFSNNILSILKASPTNVPPPGFSGVMLLKEAKMCHQWKREYKYIIRTKLVQMCKSCEAKPAYSGCCLEYSIKNRKAVTIIVGWQSNVDDPVWFGGTSKQYNNFFERNFMRGGMMSVKKARKHIEWKEAYILDAKMKDVQVCKSCEARPAHSGCCSEYSLENRKKLRMIIGWS